MNKIWQNKVDNKYDVFVESDGDGYGGFLVIIENNKELLREHTSISYAAKFGPDISDVAKWEERCIQFIDKK